MNDARTVAGAVAAAAAGLPGDSPRFEAEVLLAHALGRDRAWLYAHAGEPLPGEASARFAELVEARRGGRPVAHLLGRRGFWTFELAVSDATLIPRPDTELLVEAALARLPAGRPVRVADLGTGSGAIALAIASERPLAVVDATDASAAALAMARGNAEALGIANVAFHQGEWSDDWLAPLAGRRYALVASNPPYLPEDDPHLVEGDLRFEPRTALVAGPDGLSALRCIIAGAPSLLDHGGFLLLEHGFAQAAQVRALFDAAGFGDVATLRDLEGRERVTLGCRPTT